MKKAFLMVGWLIAAPALATDSYNQIHFGVSAKKVVQNDEITARLVGYAEHTNSKQVADSLAKMANQAISIAKSYPKVELKIEGQSVSAATSGYETGNKILHYRGQVTLSLTTKDQQMMSELLAKLQPTLALDGLNFEVSKKAQERIQDELQAQAIIEFNRQAKTLAESFGAEGYKIIKITLPTYQSHEHELARSYSVSPSPMSMMKASFEDVITEQDLSKGGERELDYRLNGIIELTGIRP